MHGPTTREEARKWIREAVAAGRYSYPSHFSARLFERKVTLPDVLCAVKRCRLVEPYTEPPHHDGTCWRVFGRDLDQRELGIGVEAYTDDSGRKVVLVTVFLPER